MLIILELVHFTLYSHGIMPENSNISWVLKRIGDIQAENRPRPSPKPNEVEIAVKVTGICGSDGNDKALFVYTLY